MKFKLLLLLLLPTLCFAQGKPKLVSVLNGKVTLMVPSDLKPMSDEMWQLKYNNRARPNLVLSDADGTVNLVVELTRQPSTESQMLLIKNAQLAQMKRNRPDLEIISESVKAVNGKKIVCFKFLAQAVDQKVFNYFFLAVVDGKILMCTFNCIEKLQAKWESAAEGIVASLKIK